MASILIIDDEENIRNSLSNALERRGHRVTTAENFAEGLNYTDEEFDITFLDVMLPDGNGLDLLKNFLTADPAGTIVMISGHAGIDMAVEAIKAGAYDFIEKPVSLDRVMVLIENAVRQSHLEAEKERLSSRLYGDLIGNSGPMKELKRNIAKSAPKATRFLITGENGTGKELVAHLIHRSGKNSNGPFIAINCAALPAELVEAELFGHTAGAFTGAAKKRRGRFLEADGGTLFLDEIGEMPMPAQAKILRAIESGEITPVGSDKPEKFSCILIAATNRDPRRMIEENKFREDLYFRLNVVRFEIPPLRKRTEDITLLSEHFLIRFAAESGGRVKVLTKDALEYLGRYPFPGNVRELRNLMERINIYIDPGEVTRAHLESLMPTARQDRDESLKEAVEKYEKSVIDSALTRHDRNVAETARALGLERSHLYKKLRKYHLK